MLVVERRRGLIKINQTEDDQGNGLALPITNQSVSGDLQRAICLSEEILIWGGFL